MADNKEEEKDTSVRLRADKFPVKAKNVRAFARLDAKQCGGKESIISWNGVDRRQKTEELMACLDKDCEPVDLKKYVLQLTMVMNGGYYVGTGTIIRIIRDTLYILTCAHNVVSFHPLNSSKSYATNIWFDFDGRKVTATKLHVYPAYKKGNELGNDLALIVCRVSFSFMFYHTYPKLAVDIEIPSYLRGRRLVAIDWLISKSDKAAEPEEEEKKWKVSIYGYPGEKDGEFWGMAGSVRIAKEKRSVFCYDDIDTTGGQSGSPIIDIDTNQIIGVHTNGDYLGVKENYGTKLNYSMLEWIDDLMPCQVGQHPKVYRKQIRELKK